MSPTAPDRKRTPCRVGALALALGIAAAGAAQARAADQQRIEQSEQELQRLRERMQALSRRLEQEREQKSELRAQLERAERKVAAALAELRRVRTELAAQNERMRATQAQRSAAQTRLDALKQALATQLRAAYAMGSRTQAQMLLSLDDAGRLGRLLTYADYLNRARAQQLAAVHAQLDEIALLEQRIEAQRAALAALEAELAQNAAALESGRDERRRMLAQLDARLASGTDELRQLQAQEREIQKLLASLQDLLADIPSDLGHEDRPFAQLRGRLPWPLRGPVLADFGTPKAGGRLAWTGRWIGARQGAPVKAVARGRVAYVGWLQRYGHMVILEHEGGYFTLYGHNATVRPETGEWVDAGEVIATAGDTGGHDRSGVYLEIRKGSLAQDPRQWLAK